MFKSDDICLFALLMFWNRYVSFESYLSSFLLMIQPCDIPTDRPIVVLGRQDNRLKTPILTFILR